MLCRQNYVERRSRRAAAALELALVLPILAFLLVVIVDFCRVHYYSVTLSNCARSGALYASDPYSPLASTYTPYPAGATQAALADATNLGSPQPTVSTMFGASASGPFGSGTPSLDGNGNPTGYVQCTVTWQFKTFSRFPGLPDMTLTRSVVMRVVPRVPN